MKNNDKSGSCKQNRGKSRIKEPSSFLFKSNHNWFFKKDYLMNLINGRPKKKVKLNLQLLP